MSGTYTMRKMAEEQPRCMDGSSDAACALGHDIAGELEIDVDDTQATKLGRAAWGLHEGRLTAGWVRSHVLRRCYAMREEEG